MHPILIDISYYFFASSRFRDRVEISPKIFMKSRKIQKKSMRIFQQIGSICSYLRYQGSDFIGPIGTYDIYFVANAPPERKEYLTLVKPFDSYIWVFTAASVVGVSISLILINKMHATWSNESSTETIFQSIMKIYSASHLHKCVE